MHQFTDDLSVVCDKKNTAWMHANCLARAWESIGERVCRKSQPMSVGIFDTRMNDTSCEGASSSSFFLAVVSCRLPSMWNCCFLAVVACLSWGGAAIFFDLLFSCLSLSLMDGSALQHVVWYIEVVAEIQANEKEVGARRWNFNFLVNFFVLKIYYLILDTNIYEQYLIFAYGMTVPETTAKENPKGRSEMRKEKKNDWERERR